LLEDSGAERYHDQTMGISNNRPQSNTTWAQSLGHRSWILLLPILLGAPTVFMGPAADDYFHQVVLQGGFTAMDSHGSPLLDLFSFLPNDPSIRADMRDLGVVPWWTPDETRAAFFRPLSALTHMLDHALWPRSFVLAHLHNILWMCLALWAVRRLFLATGLVGTALGLALLFFAVDEAHVFPVAWIANRNVLLALFFGCLSIERFVHWRQHRGRVFWSLSLFSLSLLSAEAGVCVLAYIAAWSIVFEETWSRRIRSLLPFLAIVIVWRIAYNAMGFGEWGTGIYDDPLSDPLNFLGMVIERLPTLMLGLWIQIPTDASALLPSFWMKTVALLGACLCLLLARQLKSLLSQDPQARFWVLGMLLSLVPLCATIPMNRLLFFPGLGAFATLGLFLSHRRRLASSGWFWLHGPASIVLCIAASFGFLGFKAGFELAASSEPSNAQADDHVIYLSGVAMAAAYTIITPLSQGEPYPRSVDVLSHATQDQVITTLDPHTLSITSRNGWFYLPAERIFRSSQKPIGSARTFRTKRFTAEITDVTPDGRPKTVRFRFNRPLSHPTYRWMCFDPMTLTVCKPPAIGKSIHLRGMLPW